MVIYTKRGDKGETSMFDKLSAQRARVSKDSLRVEALGAIDELNSFLGITKTQPDDTKINKIIDEIQRNLLIIGSITAGSKLRFFNSKTKQLEKIIDQLEVGLPVLKNFVVPGGLPAAAQLQYARALSRRVERRMVALSKEQEVRTQILQYLNRLSDCLFMLAREVNSKAGIKDAVWIGKKR
ncbi:MAG: hypothetical protein UT08_C0018G0045 [Candidatus Woesebacteria bacterium GW2011_GWB1_38_8]|uniref:Corrinoid adenosyltransferase n=2 Tax=Candidatus Woeseibacteriota TaxID=1752722 RepID=A0A0G0NEV5_9BACT|nr:MAG: hypothetical protein UT08_C0018G0045 [Candidatus Woesebacteria bacterium GW2011_GWB1_38_8]OGM21726.1 MAG: ATP:cob(I)alamin adenosyltransferase [Candidatus Woesebacteria bacterium RIFCSPHIGHO2_01_FULL_38_9b]